MKQGLFTIKENSRLAEGVWKMVLTGEPGEIKPGQFIDIRLPEKFLRRPISVYDAGPDFVTVIYKVLGHGTEQMTGLPAGTVLDVLTELGNGYDLSKAGDAPLLIGGGIGVPPMYMAAKKLLAAGLRPTVLLGFNSSADAFCIGEFESLGCDVRVATADGSIGTKGFVTDIIPENYSYFYCCGRTAMLKSVYAAVKGSGEFSMEERMGCGFGACMGCTVKTADGYKRVCKDGPVFAKEEIVWAD